jgi:purine nucleosidase
MAPLTNLALALQIDRTLPQRVARLVIMGGAVTGRGNTRRVSAEFNIGFDPEAAHVVFSSWPQFTLVDWEATMRHGIEFERLQRWLDADDVRARFFAAISRKTRDWTRSRGRPRLLVAMHWPWPWRCSRNRPARQEHHVAIELDGTLTRGATVVDRGNRLNEGLQRAPCSMLTSCAEALIAVALGAAAKRPARNGASISVAARAAGPAAAAGVALAFRAPALACAARHLGKAISMSCLRNTSAMRICSSVRTGLC